MERKRASDFPQELLDIFHLYVHGDIDRRAFLDRAGKFAVGGLTAVGLLDMLTPNYAWAQQIQKTDARIHTEYASVASPQGNGSIKGYFVRPADASKKYPAVIVIHENRGLNPYIEDVARRLGVEEYLALAPDGLTSVGGYPGDDEKGGQLFGQVDRAKMTEDFVAAANWLKTRPECTGKLGAVGFCFGGGIVNTACRENAGPGRRRAVLRRAAARRRRAEDQGRGARPSRRDGHAPGWHLARVRRRAYGGGRDARGLHL